MRIALLAVGLLAATACGLNQEKFGEDFVEFYCQAYEECDTSGRPCPVNLDNARRAGDCDFDRKAAKECLSADYTCDDTIQGFEVVNTPDACLVVCGEQVQSE